MKKELKKKDKLIKNIVITIYFIFLSVLFIGFYILYSGSQLYETLLFIIVVLFVHIGIFIKNSGLSPNQKLTLFFSLVIALFTIIQVWVAFYTKIPRVYTPGIKCPEYINITPAGHGNFTVIFGNYGELPAWLKFDFQSTIESLSTIGDAKYTTVLIPITYRDNKQDEFTFKFKVDIGAPEIGFKLKYLVYGDDIIDKFSASLKMSYNIYNELPCGYSNVNNITYSRSPNKS